MTSNKTERCTPGASAFACGLPTPQLDGFPDAVQSFMRVGAPLEGKWLELCGHRVSAWLDWPENLCACKTMKELNDSQLEYLTVMQQHYSDFVDGMMQDTLMVADTFEEESADDTSGQKAPEPVRKVA